MASGFSPLDDPLHPLQCQRFDIGPIREIRIGHDRRWIGVDEDGPITLFLQGSEGLGTGIVEFAGLADDDRPGAQDEDRLQISPLRHVPRKTWSTRS